MLGADGPDQIIEDGGDATMLIYKGKEFEEKFAKDGSLPDPESTSFFVTCTIDCVEFSFSGSAMSVSVTTTITTTTTTTKTPTSCPLALLQMLRWNMHFNVWPLQCCQQLCRSISRAGIQ